MRVDVCGCSLRSARSGSITCATSFGRMESRANHVAESFGRFLTAFSTLNGTSRRPQLNCLLKQVCGRGSRSSLTYIMLSGALCVPQKMFVLSTVSLTHSHVRTQTNSSYHGMLGWRTRCCIGDCPSPSRIACLCYSQKPSKDDPSLSCGDPDTYS